MDAQFFERLLATFRTEADEHIKNISSGLVSLENAASEDEKAGHLEIIYREAHSLKGAARAVNLNEIEGTCQNIENIFAGLKKGEIIAGQGIYDLLHESIDHIGIFLNTSGAARDEAISQLAHLTRRLQEFFIEHYQSSARETGQATDPGFPNEDDQKAPDIPDIDLQSIRKLRENLIKQNGNSGASREQMPARQSDANIPQQKPAPRQSQDDLLRVSFAKLDHLYHYSEEMLATRIRFGQITEELQSVHQLITLFKKEWRHHETLLGTFRSRYANNTGMSTEDSFILQQLTDYMSKAHRQLSRIDLRASALQKAAQSESKLLQSNVDGMLGTLREMLILPFSHLTDLFPKMTRDIARELNKEVDLQILGAEIEVEKRVLDAIKDPLIHLIRNALDHGIEKPAARIQNGKPARGKIILTITQTDASQVQITILDDGAGLNIEALKKSALKRNIIRQDDLAKLSNDDIYALIFRSGISTSPVITDISGRGLGMAIVKEKIEKLNGSVQILTEHGKGTRFIISMPVSIAAQRAIMVRCLNSAFLLPSTHLNKVLRLREEQIVSREGKLSFVLDKNPIPIVSLTELLQLGKPSAMERLRTLVAILSLNDQVVAFSFDELLDEQEIVIKSFNKQIKKIRNIAGANVTADGKIIPVLDANDLMRSAFELLLHVNPDSESAPVLPKRVRRILVADDSITSRMLMKDILETAGYHVDTANDGVDAITQLKTSEFDLIISDVEMPRLNGFDLTKSVRENKKTTELPVILVTGLSRREDMEKGIDVGANAYVIKSTFDQKNLLEIINRLIG